MNQEEGGDFVQESPHWGLSEEEGLVGKNLFAQLLRTRARGASVVTVTVTEKTQGGI